MPTPSPASHRLFEPGRLIALIDGVFAVALTLLVLDLKLPPESSNLAEALRQMLPAFLVYLVVFASIAGYWTIHHGQFRNLSHVDARLVLFSLINLLFVTLYPLTASIVGAHPSEPLAVVCLSVNSLLYCLSAWAIWSYAASQLHLLSKEADSGSLKREAEIMLFVAISLAIAIPLSYVSIALAYTILVLCAPLSAIWETRRRKNHVRLGGERK
jgi:uncharacterized membrane protein